MMSRRKLLSAAVAGILMCLSALPGRAATEQDPKAFVSQLATDAMETLTAKGVPDHERAVRFRTLFVNAVDMPELSKFVLGRYWRSATPEQQQEFLKDFEDIVVLTWSTRFKDYASDLRHEVVGVSPDGERGVFVESRVSRSQQPPINLQWRLRQPDGGFKVVDLIVEGSSMAITYRSEYASVIQSNGGKIDGLLTAMRKKIADLRGDAATRTD
jgi:phospholipid transport system substrate-binding protein